MDEYKRANLNKILIIVAVVLIVITVVIIVVYGALKRNKEKEMFNYNDTVIGSNYFYEITIDTETKKIKRDGKETTLQNEFGINDVYAETLLESTGDLINYFENSTIEVEM